MNKLLIALSLLISGCASNVVYTGKVENCSGKGVESAKVIAFRNGWLPFTLPPRVGEATTTADGTFILNTTKAPHFVTHVNGDIVTINEEGKLSINTCK